MDNTTFNALVRQYADQAGARVVSLEFRGSDVYLEFDRPEQERVCVTLANYAEMDKMRLLVWVNEQVHPDAIMIDIQSTEPILDEQVETPTPKPKKKK